MADLAIAKADLTSNYSGYDSPSSSSPRAQSKASGIITE